MILIKNKTERLNIYKSIFNCYIGKVAIRGCLLKIELIMERWLSGSTRGG